MSDQSNAGGFAGAAARQIESARVEELKAELARVTQERDFKEAVRERLEAERDEARARLDELTRINSNIVDHNTEMATQTDALRARLARADQALTFYADERNYGPDNDPGEPVGLGEDFDTGMVEIEDWKPDRGAKARAALASPSGEDG